MIRTLFRTLCAVVCVIVAPVANAAAEDTSTPTELDTVVVVGSRAAEPLQQVVGSVSAIERDELERAGVANTADLARMIPGLAVPTDAARFGRLGFNLRGLDGNRVSIQIDGVPLPDGFSVGQFAAAGRDLADLQMVQRVEVLRGPASTLYGSKALAGVVAYTTRSPADLLWRGQDTSSGARSGFDNRDDSRLSAAHFAARSNAWSALVQLAHRAGHATDNHPYAGGMDANPVDAAREGALAKLAYDGDARGRYVFTLEATRGRQRTDVRSLVFGPGRYGTTTALEGNDRWRRNRVSMDAHWQAPATWLDALDMLLYGQQAASAQLTDQHRNADAQTRYPSLRTRRFDLLQDSLGLKLVAQTHAQWLGLAHWHVFGIDLAAHDYRGLRDAREINLATGSASNVVLGERFPVRDFPDSRVQEMGVFWQDEISLGTHWALVPGMRGERYRMDARSDPIWHADNPSITVADVASTRWTPKVGLRFNTQGHTFYLQAVLGYRAPPFSDVNIGLYLPTLNYRVLPNPGLRAETSTGLEAGWRWNGDAWQTSVALYDNRFRDLIESRANLGTDPLTGIQQFQSINRDRAHIRGVELEARWYPRPDDARLRGWFIQAHASAGRGDDTVRHLPLNSIQPARASLGVGFEADPRRGAMLTLTGVGNKQRVDQSAGALYRPAGHAVWDVSAWWQPTEPIRINLQLRNLANRRYFDWASLRGVTPGARDLDLYAQPGRSLALDVALEW